MLVWQLISVLILAHIVVMATPVKKNSTSLKKSPVNKREAIDLVEGEKPASLLFSSNLTRSHHYWTRKRTKREAIELVETDPGEKPASLLFSAANLTRSHHYWTRKRGRDRSTQDPDYYYYQYGYRTTRRSFAARSTQRPKRNTPDSLESGHVEVGSQLTEPTRAIQSITRQQAGIEANLNDPNMIATDRTTEGPIHKGPKPHDRSKPRQSHKRFESKL